MDEKLIIDLARLDPDGEVFSGEVDAVDIDEEFVRPFGGIRYRLEVRLFGREMCVRPEQPANTLTPNSTNSTLFTKTLFRQKDGTGTAV